MILKILSRIVIYACLAAFFFAFYLQDQMSDFLLRRTTVTSRIEQVSELDPPTLTICMDPPFKVSFAKKFNFSNQFAIFFGDYNFSSYQERFEKLNYILNQDFQISLKIMDENIESSNEITLGQVSIKNFTFEVFEILTKFHGQCYTIEPKFNVKTIPFEMLLRIQPNSSLDEDYPRKFYVYLTSKDDWHGIVTNDWPQYNPTKAQCLKIAIKSHFTTLRAKRATFTFSTKVH